MMPRWPEARLREVIEVEFNRGAGVVGDPVRRVFAYYDRDGVLLAERDTLNPDFIFSVPADTGRYNIKTTTTLRDDAQITFTGTRVP